MPAFGRLPAVDVRDRNFPMRLILEATAVPPTPRSYHWASAGLFDQGNEGICVAAAWKQFLMGSPLRTKGGRTMQEWYDLFILADEWTQNDNDNVFPRNFGTSVRAGAKVLSSLGHILEYRWAENSEDARLWVGWKSPLVGGFNWYTGMMDTDSKQYIHPTGSVEGGHAIYICGYSLKRDAFRIRNSWGDSFGYRGFAWLHREDFEQLLAEDGEVCTAIEKVAA